MPGKLYVIGVGPGDPELITVKAVRILKGVPCIMVPRGREEGMSLALSIIEQAVDLAGKEIVPAHFPMVTTRGRKEGRGAAEISELLDARWDKAAEAVLERLREGRDVAFVTLGDPAIYSTFFYLHPRLVALEPELIMEIVPGISSVNVAAAGASLPLALAAEKIAIVPANYDMDLDAVLRDFETVVLLKAGGAFETVKEALKVSGRLSRAICVSRAGLPGERIITDLRQVEKEDLDYFTLVLVKR